MIATRFVLPALLASPLLLALEPRGDALTFHPAKDSSLTKVSEMSLSFEIGDISMIVSGNDMSNSIPADVGGDMTMNMTWTDKYVDTQDGKPMELIRSYGDMEGSMEMGGGGETENNEIPEFDALSGKSIRFKWNAEKNAYDIAYHECEGEEKNLIGQQADMDFRWALPTKEVAVGDKWTVSTEFMREMLESMKNSDFGEDGAEVAAIMQDELFPQLEKLIDKIKASCEYKGTRDEEGVNAGVVAMTFEGEGTLDLKSMLESVMAAQMPEGMDIQFEVSKAELTFKITGKGELLWDIASGHIVSAEQEAEFTVNFGLDASVDAQGQNQSIEAEVEVPGKFSQTVTSKK